MRYFLFVPLFLLTTSSVFATVGGPTIIHDFTYNPTNESVYYVKQDGGGRGCPPELLALSLTTEKVTAALSCDQGEQMTLEQVNTKIDALTNGFKFLTPLNLKRNGIAIDLQFTKTETFGSDSDEIMWRHFIVTLYQNGKKVKEFPITGCNLEQPFTFQGYSIPGFDKKIVILSSAKGNCFEGGYINEALYVVGGVDNLDKSVTDNFYKGQSALLPNEGNLVVYESDSPNIDNLPTTPATTTVTETPAKESLFSRLINWIKSFFK